ncbi:sigma-70 family rna polymerase sigma factor : RNA polymerase sigma factor, sigma-70 family OS=Singulisphaera acidiphila (strain ATCC BAA-1392 / DSM 18658 / VKM B-2454 / MOB10) GN=Sinac_4264 PE=4 SV=1: Sigma70_r2: Sigma70_r4_2 [Gemmata massiliana]|uniref:RNA polymerase sigma-70 region 2 domain-containing protein n=1 Tax=Gemmata massiliana TaxID=1210884 RepID=A0A6P2D5C8_9BACT|nr:sigma-70 family RNA polymerase sigma factor [Gemmata massiliana]VTR96273.1 sigma-70 family rna polymerase sigma factor : RNA polymerase sigma factor, sigma-70 family OS=Singulisphaera acidiphila (strain ATCC BAA-1392 / DSM 18658 / VKM B-2454 / MOB10) GN=Sinac_4264 PE=4 SV=1: Sigma70_r2: Sigma70_r4_2 [Gemmata massiliana]
MRPPQKTWTPDRFDWNYFTAYPTARRVVIVAQTTEMIRALTRGMAAEASTEPDPELIRRFLGSGGEDVFEILVRRHGPMVYRVCRRVAGHEQDAEDAFQATFLVLARNLRALRHVPSLASWLHGVARRVALKAKARVAALKRREQRAAAPESTAHVDPAWSDVGAALDEELGRLPERWRLPLVLCYLEARTQDEAARELGWGKSTLRRRLTEARAALAARLAQRGVWPTVLAGVLVSDCTSPAALPRELVGPTVGAAAAIASGRPGPTVAAGVSNLTEGVFTVSRLKLKVAALVAAVLVLGAGAPLRVSSAELPAGPAGVEEIRTADGPGPQKADTKPADELERWQGRWRVTTAAINGKDRKDERIGLAEIVVTGKKVTLRFRHGSPTEGASVDGELELIPIKAKKGALADPGFIVHMLIPVTGNYHFTNGQLVICYYEPGSEEGAERPAGFGSQEGSKRELYRLERVVDKEPPAQLTPKKRAQAPGEFGEGPEPAVPDLSGRWQGDEWGQIELAMTKRGTYVGTYTDTFGPVKGSVTLEWVPREQRFHGTWGEGKDRFGTISVRLHGREIRGAFTTDPASRISPGSPALSDLKWVPQPTR